eukprot:355754-Chlamydomonas_euryale.AAC.17
MHVRVQNPLVTQMGNPSVLNCWHMPWPNTTQAHAKLVQPRMYDIPDHLTLTTGRLGRTFQNTRNLSQSIPTKNATTMTTALLLQTRCKQQPICILRVFHGITSKTDFIRNMGIVALHIRHTGRSDK